MEGITNTDDDYTPPAPITQAVTTASRPLILDVLISHFDALDEDFYRKDFEHQMMCNKREMEFADMNGNKASHIGKRQRDNSKKPENSKDNNNNQNNNNNNNETTAAEEGGEGDKQQKNKINNQPKEEECMMGLSGAFTPSDIPSDRHGLLHELHIYNLFLERDSDVSSCEGEIEAIASNIHIINQKIARKEEVLAVVEEKETVDVRVYDKSYFRGNGGGSRRVAGGGRGSGFVGLHRGAQRYQRGRPGSSRGDYSRPHQHNDTANNNGNNNNNNSINENNNYSLDNNNNSNSLGPNNNNNDDGGDYGPEHAAEQANVDDGCDDDGGVSLHGDSNDIVLLKDRDTALGVGDADGDGEGYFSPALILNNDMINNNNNNEDNSIVSEEVTEDVTSTHVDTSHTSVGVVVPPKGGILPTPTHSDNYNPYTTGRKHHGRPRGPHQAQGHHYNQHSNTPVQLDIPYSPNPTHISSISVPSHRHKQAFLTNTDITKAYLARASFMERIRDELQRHHAAKAKRQHDLDELVKRSKAKREEELMCYYTLHQSPCRQQSGKLISSENRRARVSVRSSGGAADTNTRSYTATTATQSIFLLQQNNILSEADEMSRHGVAQGEVVIDGQQGSAITNNNNNISSMIVTSAAAMAMAKGKNRKAVVRDSIQGLAVSDIHSEGCVDEALVAVKRFRNRAEGLRKLRKREGFLKSVDGFSENNFLIRQSGARVGSIGTVLTPCQRVLEEYSVHAAKRRLY